MNLGRSPSRRPVAASCVAGLALPLLLGGCGLQEVLEQVRRIESAGTLEGRVTAQNLPQRDVLVAILRRGDDGELSLNRVVTPAANGTFHTRIGAGDYYVGAFVDMNRDGHFQPDEPGRFYGKPTIVQVSANQDTQVALSINPASKPAPFLILPEGPTQPELGANTGVVASLDDSRFDPDNGLLGLWRPFDFIQGPQGGLFMLEEYDPQRIPVLFVHGVGTTPRDFASVVQGLDVTRYQAWVLYYPSGLPLEMVSTGLAGAMHQLQRRHGFRQYAVVAHSMGGLVARSYIQRQRESYPEDALALKMLLTVNSPLGGMDNAALAVERSPVVVPSWGDVATGSEFLARLASWPWPAEVPYYLVFSYDGNRNGDGTVPLASQLPAIFQGQARRLYGFQGTHAGTLSDPVFAALVNQLLDASTGKSASAGGR